MKKYCYQCFFFINSHVELFSFFETCHFSHCIPVLRSVSANCADDKYKMDVKMTEKNQQPLNDALFTDFIQGYWRMAQWGMTAQERLTFIKQHMELGITTVDHAPVYGKPSCELLFGEALKLQPSVRDDLTIISKCGIVPGKEVNGTSQVAYYDSRASHILSSVDESLQRLGVDNLDILLIHRPDLLMDADEINGAFEKLYQAGKVKHFGVSNFSKDEFALLQSRVEKPLVTNQIEINPLHTQAIEDGTLAQLQQHRVRPMAWSCLAGGDIYNGDSEQARRVRDTLNVLKEELNADSIDQVIFAWLMRLPTKPALLLGTGKIERVRTAVAAQQLELTHEQWYRLLEASKGHGVA